MYIMFYALLDVPMSHFLPVLLLHGVVGHCVYVTVRVTTVAKFCTDSDIQCASNAKWCPSRGAPGFGFNV